MIRTHEQHLMHYGILRKSGRYPWGSGGTQSKRNRDFLDYVSNLKKQGLTDAQIADGVGLTRNELVAARSIALAQQKQEKIIRANRLAEKGYSNVEIGRIMGINESSVRALRAPGELEKTDAIQTTANMLREHVNQKNMIDIGVGVERQVGVTRTRLDTSIAVLKEEGYVVHNIKQQQAGTGKYTTIKVLAKPGTTLHDVQLNRGDIQQITSYSEDSGHNFFGFQEPISVNSRRIAINYAEQGGADADGVIFVRPGVKDLSLGSGRYSQVRIMVDKTHYLKGMAVYKEDLPEGVDLVFNTNKSNTGRKKDAMKPIEGSEDFPFKSVVRQLHDENGKVSSAMNLVGTKEGSGEEGSWEKWSKNLSSQMLSKQSPDLARQQLALTYSRRQKEFEEIMKLTNPTVKKDLLLKFAESTDSAAVHLKAASLPRQATRVILPVSSMKPNEIYAPGFRDGERVVLIRHPHAGTFEIPELTVNNRNREGRKLIGSGQKVDAVGIHHQVAQHLSGADFDGDTVLVIPNNKRFVKTTDPLDQLKDFNPQVYKLPKDSPIPKMDSARKGLEMGKISNLITDMSLQGASQEELARAVKHSMVVIDAEKHGLDFRQSEKDQGILALKERYQGGKRAGAQTLISRAGAETRVLERTERRAVKGGPIDPLTGAKVFEPTGRQVPKTKAVIDPVTGKKKMVPTGEFRPATIKSKKLAETSDAFTLVDKPGTVMESIYAQHSNQLKALANQARKESLPIKGTPTSPAAKKVYADEVSSLNAKLNIALKNAPLERQAQLLANAHVAQIRQANPNMEKDEVTKIKQIALNNARARTGARKHRIDITQSEWDAIQAGAISKDRLEKILHNADPDQVKKLAMPKDTPKMNATAKARAQAMLAAGYTQQEVADHLGIGLTTLKVGLGE